MKVLIVTPSKKLMGGVTFYYKGVEAIPTDDAPMFLLCGVSSRT